MSAPRGKVHVYSGSLPIWLALVIALPLGALLLTSLVLAALIAVVGAGVAALVLPRLWRTTRIETTRSSSTPRNIAGSTIAAAGPERGTEDMRAVTHADEYMHANTGEGNFNESMYFNFYDRTARTGAFARIGNRPNERYAEMTIAIYQPDGTALFNYKRPEIADNSAFDAGGMRFGVTEPFKHLTVSYDGHAVYLAEPRDLEDPRRAFTTNPHQPVALALDWYGQSPMFGGEGGESGDMVFAKGHYEQHGRAVGRLTVDGVTRAVDGFGLRDHSWGPRSWQSPSYYRWLIGQFDDGFGFMGSQIVTQAGAELLSGFVFRDGENHFVHHLEVETEWKDPGHYHDAIALTLHHGSEKTRITGRVVTMLPLRNRRDGKVTRISEGLTEWRCGDHVGYGWSEYLDQTVSGAS